MRRLKKKFLRAKIEWQKSETSLNTIVMKRIDSEIALNVAALKKIKNEISLQEINLKLRLIEGDFSERVNEVIENNDKRKHDNNTVSYHS
jgi:hypothetical protein